MSDRIQINGVWYVREEKNASSTPILDDELTCFTAIEWETDTIRFEASRIYRDDDTLYDDFAITVTFKDPTLSPNEWATEYWDNTGFFKGILASDPESKDSLNLTWEDTTSFIRFLRKLKEKNWL
jgi:hypothetical protein